MYNRGARKIRIFADDDDRSYFTRLVGLTAQKYEVGITSMSLMSNHFHMSVRADGAVYLQAYVPHPGRDIRVFVVGGAARTSGYVGAPAAVALKL